MSSDVTYRSKLKRSDHREAAATDTDELNLRAAKANNHKIKGKISGIYKIFLLALER